MAICRQASCCK